MGDPVTAILKRSVKLGSGLVAPKGALVHGKIHTYGVSRAAGQDGRLG